MHVHVGVEDHELAIDVVNCARYFLPHLLALSTSSPFWIGRNTGLKSYRSTIFRSFPRTGIPTRMSGWSEYEGYLETLTETGCIPNGSKIWWDVRPHWKFPTIEFRICDACTRVDEAVCIAAIVQALAFKLWKLRRDNMMWRDYSSRLIEENKWRAMRFGLQGNLIDFGRRQERPAPELIREFIDWFLADAIDELGSRREVEHAYRILSEGSSADRQLATFERTGSLDAVVDQLIAETAEGVTPIAVVRPVETGVAHVRHTLGDTIAVELARKDVVQHAEGETSDARGHAVPVAIEAATLAAAASRSEDARAHHATAAAETVPGLPDGVGHALPADRPVGPDEGRDAGDRAPVLP
jgi:carboxylate-amine ligase